MKYDILSFQTNFPLNCPRRENLVNLQKKGEVARLGQGGSRRLYGGKCKEVPGIPKRLHIGVGVGRPGSSSGPQQHQAFSRFDSSQKGGGHHHSSPCQDTDQDSS